MHHSRATLATVALWAIVTPGCGSSSTPVATFSTQSLAASYSPRTDLMVIGPGLDGAPTRWYSPGFPPLRSARFPTTTPDRDIAEVIRKQLGKNVLDPAADLNPIQATQIAGLLEKYFGTPTDPRVWIPGWNDQVLLAVARPDPTKGVFKNLSALATAVRQWKSAPWSEDWTTAVAIQRELRLDDATLARGSVVYRRWCLQCHGPTGAGDGAHAIELNAMPRDYRQGIFKFVTAFVPPGVPKKGLGPSGKPLRDDLKRTIRNGLDGSMMQAFSALTEQELDDVVSYVIHLAIRGETEYATLIRTLQPTEDDPDFTGAELAWLFNQNVVFVLANWSVAARHPIPIPPENTPSEADRLASAVRGAQRYNEFGCASCHVNYGRELALKWDRWGTMVQPRNLMLGVYRGGRRGEDLYARIYGGIAPSGMNAHFDRLVGGPSYPDQPDKIWDLVHFLQALGDPAGRKRLLKADPTIKLDP
jgi:mono/diheme cytochrome c family protein